MLRVKKPVGGGAWFLTLFGAVFLLAGMGVGIFSVKNTVQTALAQNWTEVKASIISAELKRFSGDSTTYRAAGQYEYDWRGQSYSSDVLFFGNSSDSQREFHNNIVREMKSHIASGEPMIAHVNPKKPSQSILYPKIRWAKLAFSLLFATIFGGAGAAVIWFGQYASGVTERETERQKLHPKQPWLWRDEWQGPTLKNQGKATFITIAGFTTFWNLISLPVLFIVPNEVMNKGNPLALIALIFPIIGAFMGVWTYRLYHGWQRFKQSSFTLQTFPAGLGHSLQGYFTAHNHLPPETIFHVTLSSIRRYVSGSGKNRSTREQILWQDEQAIPLNEGRFGKPYRLPIIFSIPENAKPSNWEDASNVFLWRLEFKSDLEGANLDQDFEVPIFDPAQYKFALPSPEAAALASQNRFVYKGDWQKTGVIYNQYEDSQLYYFPAARHKMIALGLSAVTLIFGGVASAYFFTQIPIFICVVFGLFALVFAFFSARLWLHKSSIETSRRGIILRRGMFSGSYVDITPAQIKELSLESTMTSGTTKYYDIAAKLNSGKTLKLAHHIRGRRDAKNLIEKLRADIGMAA